MHLGDWSGQARPALRRLYTFWGHFKPKSAPSAPSARILIRSAPKGGNRRVWLEQSV